MEESRKVHEQILKNKNSLYRKRNKYNELSSKRKRESRTSSDGLNNSMIKGDSRDRLSLVNEQMRQINEIMEKTGRRNTP